MLYIKLDRKRTKYLHLSKMRVQNYVTFPRAKACDTSIWRDLMFQSHFHLSGAITESLDVLKVFFSRTFIRICLEASVSLFTLYLITNVFFYFLYINKAKSFLLRYFRFDIFMLCDEYGLLKANDFLTAEMLLLLLFLCSCSFLYIHWLLYEFFVY